MNPFRSIIFIAVTVFVLDAAAVFAAGSNIPSAEVVSLLRSANIVKIDYPIRAVMSGPTATILTRRSAKSSDSQVKVDAILIGKTLFDSYGSQISNVDVLFSTEQEPDAYAKINVSQQLVKDFGSGKLSESQVMASLQIAHEDDRTLVPQSQAELQPGPYLEQRMALQDQIQDLQRGGTDTKPFQGLFDQIEQSIRDGKVQKAHDQLSSLAQRLQEQVELRKAANVPIVNPYKGGNGMYTPHGGAAGSVSAVPVTGSAAGSQRIQAIVSHCLNSPSGPRAGALFQLHLARAALANHNLKNAEQLFEGIEQQLGLSAQYAQSLPALAELTDAIKELNLGIGAPASSAVGQTWGGAGQQRKSWGAGGRWR